MEQIGPYVLSHRIGAGGMAEIWMAQRAMLGVSKIVAIKLLASHLASKEQYREMFREEARLSMLLNHSNIVQVFELGEDRGECYMAMEWIDGVNLAELQAMLWECGRALPVELAMYITGEILGALDYAHNLVCDDAAMIVHRDVSPSNVLLSLAGEIKLADFGVARFGTEETSGVHVKGKLRYMAPEQLRGCSRSGAVDIYATGAVLHEMLDGQKFRGTNTDDVQLVGALCENEIPELGHSGRIFPQLDRLRRRLLAPDPEDRLDANAALRALRRCPGYRNGAHELAALVRWCRGLEPSDRSHRPQRFVASDASFAGGGLGETSGTARWSNTAKCSTEVQRGRPLAALAVALAGLCVGCLGIGLAVSSVHESPPMQARASTLEPAMAVASSVVSEPASWPVIYAPPRASLEARDAPLESALSVPPTPEAPDQGEDQGEDQSEAPDQSEPESAAAPATKQRHAPVEVKFAAGAFKFAYLKVGNKRILIEPGGALELSPGIHKVYARFSATEEWIYFGKLNIRPKRSYLVKLAEPQRLAVKTLDSDARE